MAADFVENWETQARKGLVEFAVLHALRVDRLYGYQIVKRLEEIPGLVISAGTIYPMMSRLGREGLVKSSLEESPEGPARKYYELTATGRAALKRIDDRWKAMLAGLDQLRGESDATD